MNFCILCLEPITEAVPPEHPWLDSLGGRFVVHDAICQPCNAERMGNGPDDAFANDVRTIRAIANFKTGKRRPPPSTTVTTSNGQEVELRAGGVPVAPKRKPFDIGWNDDGELWFWLDVSSLSELVSVIPHMAAKARISQRAIEIALLQFANTRGLFLRSTHVNPTPQSVGIGGTESMRSMAKGALVLWMHAVGNAEVCHSRYNLAREFAREGLHQKAVFGSLDTRPLPVEHGLVQAFGNNVNVLYVCSNTQGRVIGYWRLYNVAAWVFELCPEGAPPNRAFGMAFDPFKPTRRSENVANQFPLEFDWLAQPNPEAGFSQTKTGLSHLMTKAKRNSLNSAIVDAYVKTFENFGLDPEQEIPMWQREIVLRAFSNRAAHIIHRKPFDIIIGVPQLIAAFKNRGARTAK